MVDLLYILDLILTVPNLGQEAFFIQALEDTVDGYLGDFAFLSYSLEGSIYYVMFITNTQQKKEDIQRFGVR